MSNSMETSMDWLQLSYVVGGGADAIPLLRRYDGIMLDDVLERRMLLKSRDKLLIRSVIFKDGASNRPPSRTGTAVEAFTLGQSG